MANDLDITGTLRRILEVCPIKIRRFTMEILNFQVRRWTGRTWYSFFGAFSGPFLALFLNLSACPSRFFMIKIKSRFYDHFSRGQARTVLVEIGSRVGPYWGTPTLR